MKNHLIIKLIPKSGNYSKIGIVSSHSVPQTGLTKSHAHVYTSTQCEQIPQNIKTKFSHVLYLKVGHLCHQCHQMSALPVSTRDTNKNHHLYSDTVLCSNVSIYHQYYIKLEIWGRAQFEATRHRKSDWKYNLVRCSVCKNLRQQHPFQPKYTSCKSPFGWVNVYVLNLFVSGPKCTNFFRPIFAIKIRI